MPSAPSEASRRPGRRPPVVLPRVVKPRAAGCGRQITKEGGGGEAASPKADIFPRLEFSFGKGDEVARFFYCFLFGVVDVGAPPTQMNFICPGMTTKVADWGVFGICLVDSSFRP